MPFEKGQSGNPSGRPQGAKSRVNDEIRTRINTFLDENFETIQNDVMQLEPRERVRFYIELLQYGIPKLKSTDLKTDLNDNIIVVMPPEPNFTDEEREERIKVLKDKLLNESK